MRPYNLRQEKLRILWRVFLSVHLRAQQGIYLHGNLGDLSVIIVLLNAP